MLVILASLFIFDRRDIKKSPRILGSFILNLITFLRKERGLIKHYNTKINVIFVYSKFTRDELQQT